jgi:ABC-2 type transport system ATP-binding protein
MPLSCITTSRSVSTLRRDGIVPGYPPGWYQHGMATDTWVEAGNPMWARCRRQRQIRSVTGMNTQQPVISVSDLRMRYGKHEALAGLSFDVHRGELFALLGPNGAGKTSTVEILEGYRCRTGGTVSVLGTDPWHAGPSWRARIGVMLQETGPEPDLTAAECLHLYGSYYTDPWPAADLLELTGLDTHAGTKASQLSGGQRRKLDLALALTGRPQVLFLDEPTTGFDPAARRDAWEIIAALKDTGTTMILTTHYMEEAERLADRVAVVSAGTLVSQGPPHSLVSRGNPTITFTLPAGLTAADLPEPARHAVCGSPGGKLTLPAASPLPMLGSLAAWAERAGLDLPDLEVRRPSLEDVYLELTTDQEAQATP